MLLSDHFLSVAVVFPVQHLQEEAKGRREKKNFGFIYIHIYHIQNNGHFKNSNLVLHFLRHKPPNHFVTSLEI